LLKKAIAGSGVGEYRREMRRRKVKMRKERRWKKKGWKKRSGGEVVKVHKSVRVKVDSAIAQKGRITIR
jgi:hypothetical protein